MNRQIYFNFIEDKLSHLASRMKLRGGLNLLDLHLRSENFYTDFLNLLFGWGLKNINAIQHNAPGIDLADAGNLILVQVSATANRQKIESALSKDLSGYKGYSFRFVPISIDASNLRGMTFANPHGLRFTPADDIYDVPFLLKKIQMLGVDEQKKIYEFLKSELKNEPDLERVATNLAKIINVLAKEDWGNGASGFETAPYNVEAKIAYNQLDTTRTLIEEYKVHYGRVNRIYSELSGQGVNASLSILNGIRKEYAALGAVQNPDQCFCAVIEKVVARVHASGNYAPIPEDELALCVEILVVDAFVRCKIFKNPVGY